MAFFGLGDDVLTFGGTAPTLDQLASGSADQLYTSTGQPVAPGTISSPAPDASAPAAGTNWFANLLSGIASIITPATGIIKSVTGAVTTGAPGVTTPKAAPTTTPKASTASLFGGINTSTVLLVGGVAAAVILLPRLLGGRRPVARRSRERYRRR